MKLDFGKFARPFGYPRKREEKKEKRPKTPEEMVALLRRRLKARIKKLKQAWWDGGMKDMPPMMSEDLIKLCYHFSDDRRKVNEEIRKFHSDAQRSE